MKRTLNLAFSLSLLRFSFLFRRVAAFVSRTTARARA